MGCDIGHESECFLGALFIVGFALFVELANELNIIEDKSKTIHGTY
jgi:hypothetical protein